MPKKPLRFSALCAGLLTLSLVLTLLGAALAVSGTERVYFMAVNETILELKSETMPVMIKGEIYVPYTMFDTNTTGINLGVFATYNKEKSTAMVYDRKSQYLMFDLNENTTRDSSGTEYNFKAVIRNGTVYLPVSRVCQYFTDLTYSTLGAEYGYIVRVKSSAAVLSDEDFAPAAVYRVRDFYNAYLKTQAQTNKGDASPSPSTNGGTSGGSTAAPDTSPSVPGAEEDGGTVYLAFRSTDGEGLDRIMRTLDSYGLYGLFFFAPEELAARDEQVRALAAAGHRIGLILDGATQEARAAQMSRGNALLGHILRTSTCIVLKEEAGTPDEGQEGWFFWATTVDGRPDEQSAARKAREIVRSCGRSDTSFVLLDDSTQSAEVLGRMLTTMTGDGYDIRLAVETALNKG